MCTVVSWLLSSLSLFHCSLFCIDWTLLHLYRCSLWWDYIVLQTFQDWKINFRMTKPTLMCLCNEILTMVQHQDTVQYLWKTSGSYSVVTGVHNAEKRIRSVKCPRFNWILFLPTRASGYTIFRIGVVCFDCTLRVAVRAASLWCHPKRSWKQLYF